MIGRFANSAAFRQALETRLMNEYGGGRVQRARKRLAAERLIVRLQEERPSGFLLKGGFALELRLAGRARTTRDLDVTADADVSISADLLPNPTELSDDMPLEVRELIDEAQSAVVHSNSSVSGVLIIWNDFVRKGEPGLDPRSLFVLRREASSSNTRIPCGGFREITPRSSWEAQSRIG